MRKLPVSEEQKQKMFIKMCNMLRLSPAKEYDHLPERLKVLYFCMDYETIVKPLIRYDYYKKKASKRTIAFRYKKSRPFVDRVVA